MVTAYDAAEAPRPNASEFVIYVADHGPIGYTTVSRRTSKQLQEKSKNGKTSVAQTVKITHTV